MDATHSIKYLVDRLLALELADESPRLYQRAAVFEDALGNPSKRDLRDLRSWLRPRYRGFILEFAKSMVETVKRSSDNQQEDGELDDKAEALVKLSVPECGYEKPFLSESELRRFMGDAGLSQHFIDEQIGNMREARGLQRETN